MDVITDIKPLFTANLPDLHFEALTREDQHFIARISSQQPTSTCPSCGKPSHHVHSHYQRCLQDLPISGLAVCWQIQVRRFRCVTKRCKQGIFCERFAKEIVVYARNTLRNTKILEQTALLFGAKPSTKITQCLGFQGSAATLLRRAHRTALPTNAEPVKVIGVDDFAFKKGRVYGTIIVNHENHQVVDILPDRSSQTLIDWLEQHPEIESITRDRSLEYNKACTQGAPQAQQILDKWHVLFNLRDALEGILERYPKQLAALAKKFRATLNLPPYARSAKQMEAAKQALETRRERLLKIRDLHAQGKTMAQIAHELPASRTFVAKAIASKDVPEIRRNAHSRSILTPWLTMLEEKFLAGLRNGRQFWRELQAKGFTGSYERVHDWVRFRRDQELFSEHQENDQKIESPAMSVQKIHAPAFQLETVRGFAARQLVWLLLLPFEKLTQDDQKVLKALQDTIPELVKARELAQMFKQIVDAKLTARLEEWFTAMEASNSPNLVSFAKVLNRERKPLEAMITSKYSNGRAEGHVHRLKVIKRQGYGRAGFELLRKRVLLT
jgi:transposase